MQVKLTEKMTQATQHHFTQLFAQLGLPDDAQSIAHFLIVHTAMARGHRLPDVPCWTPSQAAFLRESLLQDSNWAGVVDQLSLALRSSATASTRAAMSQMP